MKCQCCGDYYDLKFKDFIHDLITCHRNPFFCLDCNENNVWYESHYHDSTLLNDFDNYIGLESKVEPSVIGQIEKIINTIIDDSEYMCIVYYNEKYNGGKQVVFPYKFEKKYIYAYGDSWHEGLTDKVHERNNICYKIPLYKIDKITKDSVFLDYYESDSSEPMYGYKGMLVFDDGSIESGYEMGIMKEVPRVSNPLLRDVRECYLNYCKEIEDPLLYWGCDYIADSMKGTNYCHLFRVKAEGHYHQYSSHGWAANRLTILEEVSKQEIIRYYESNPEKLQKLKQHWLEIGESEYLWEEYKNK